MTENNIREELSNIVHSEPLWPGDTISHQTAQECFRRGWCRRDSSGNWVATDSGKRAHRGGGFEFL